MSNAGTKVYFSLRCNMTTAELLGAEIVGPCTVAGLLEVCRQHPAAKVGGVIAVITLDGPSYRWPIIERAGAK
jgi:hypothetical protein